MPPKIPVKFDLIRKKLFVENLSLKLSPVEAAREAGFDKNLPQIAAALMKDGEVQEMIEEIKQKIAEFYDVSRERLLRDLVDGKEMARVQGNVRDMVMAINPIIDIQGYRAPKELSVAHVDLRDGEKLKRHMRSISDADLLELAEEEGFKTVRLLPTTVDGEVEDGE